MQDKIKSYKTFPAYTITIFQSWTIAHPYTYLPVGYDQATPFIRESKVYE